MLNKKILAVSIAAAFSHSAMAVVDLDASPIVPADYAVETVEGQSTLTPDGNSVIVDAGTNLNVDGEVGFGFSQNTNFWVRYDLTNAVFNTALVNGSLTGVDTTSIVQGGGTDQSFAIFQASDSTGPVGVATTLTLAIADVAAVSASNTSIRMRVFSTSSDAVNETGSLSDKSGSHINMVSALTTEFVASNLTADVDEGFIDFTGDTTEANIGSVEITLETAFAADDGAAVTRADVLADATSTLVVTGDFSTALTDSDGAVTLDTASNCSGAGTAMVVSEDGTTATRTNTAVLADATPVYVCIEPDGTTAISATEAFSATLTAAAGDLLVNT